MVCHGVKYAQSAVNELKCAKAPVCTFKNCYTVIQQCSTHNKAFFPVLCQYQCQRRDFSRASDAHYPTAFCWEFIHRKCALLFHAWRPCEENINAMSLCLILSSSHFSFARKRTLNVRIFVRYVCIAWHGAARCRAVNCWDKNITRITCGFKSPKALIVCVCLSELLCVCVWVCVRPCQIMIA